MFFLNLLTLAFAASRMVIASPHSLLDQRRDSTPETVCQASGHNKICFSNGVCDCEEKKTTRTCTYCLPNPFTGKVHCVGERPAPEAHAADESGSELKQAGTDIAPLLQKRESADKVEGWLMACAAVKARGYAQTTCDQRLNTTDKICLGSTIHDCTTQATVQNCGDGLCRELKSEDMNYTHESLDPWCITEEESNHELMKRGLSSDVRTTPRFEAECAGHNIDGLSPHPMQSICIQTHLNDTEDYKSNTTGPGQIYDCVTHSVTSTCEELHNATLLYEHDQKGLCQQLYVPDRLAKCCTEEELGKQFEEMKEFMSVAGKVPSAAIGERGDERDLSR